MPQKNEDSATLSREALQHFKEGRLQRAQGICQQILRKRQYPGALLILGWIAHQQREFETAVEHYQQYLGFKPDDAEVHYTLGLVHKELGHTERAIRHYKKSITVTNDNAAVHKALGDAYTKLARLEEAIKPYQNALAVQADDVATIINLANVFHGLHRYTQSIPLYQQALSMRPDDVQVHRHLGASLQRMGQTTKAIECYERALSLRPDYIPARIKLAEVLRELGRAEEALVQLERVVEFKPDETEAHIILARTLRGLGQAELAIEGLKHHLTLKPDCGALYYHISMIRPEQALIPAIEKLIQHPELPIGDAICCHFALGNIFKSSESFDQAFSHFLKANTLHRKTFVYDAEENSQNVDKLTKVYSNRFFQRKAKFGSTSQLPIFILGMPRSGSTLVEQIISSHGSVYGAGELQAIPEITLTVIQQLKYVPSQVLQAQNPRLPYPECMSLFDKDMAEEYSTRYLQSLELHCPGASRITDKLPGNFLRIGLIKTLFPQARIIHCQRNPLDTCISLFFHYFIGLKCSFELTELGKYYLSYQRLMSHWENLFPGEIFTVKYEELVMDQERISKQLIDYLGLTWDEKCLDFHTNVRSVMTPSNIQVRQPIFENSMDRWKPYEKHLQPLIEVLQQAL